MVSLGTCWIHLPMGWEVRPEDGLSGRGSLNQNQTCGLKEMNPVMVRIGSAPRTGGMKMVF